ncbi:uncharacterized protein LOC110448084 [Mizuhopecten yessoensis]|uniref:Uncharacterized protein n=1 Tax=Mizuhopecten yessoensis TaxID=6573 RepID=A0A210QTZ6_MIZYE|nr:uncharacterized protein LOC110448084 [Mizuhopecten yessoensis]OWF52194.1 hypothetical protein KP79_PYT20093 [Mizuhopecten yessoensis]
MYCSKPSDQETGMSYQIRIDKLKLPLYVGYVLLPASIINVILGIVVLVFLNNYSYPLPSGYQIWTGILGIVISVFGIQVGTTSNDMRQDMTPDFRKNFFAFFWSCNCVNWVATQGFGIAIACTVICAVNGCSEKNDLLIALNAISIGLTFIICFGGWVGQFYFYKFRKTYGILYDKEIRQLASIAK